MQPEYEGTSLETVEWEDGVVKMIDQTRLPQELVVLEISDVPTLVAAIRRLSVRGAPAIGVAGAYGVALAVHLHGAAGPDLDDAISSLRSARPTAVNLAKMVDRTSALISEGLERVLEEAHRIRNEELQASVSMGEYGADLADELIGEAAARTMTICNTGGLATVARGTALAVIQTLHERGRLEMALPVETRPLLQGGRLTTWELARMGAPFRLLVDGAGPFLLARGEANLVLAGADRIARNGDVANKIGTFSLALASRHAGVPFVVVAPESTIDMYTASGAEIEIEDRGTEEVVSVRGVDVAPPGAEALNPAFDITPVEFITAIVTDRRVIRPDQGRSPEDVPLGELRYARPPGLLEVPKEVMR
ncbi:MAG: S-methyl-5-thioribose-1-phosphate isomerase [Acidimicrobiia bacterium]|nr:S-methyl-5-thioribose-1-phosphate isomerase [bacterium]MXX45397.1 S-methyl-5-thioribose-1-phosphate isomerase [Acidimicrobiia bacterium]MXY74673.1 S-methyl-5-thioribose-1-phosphate isomerase [Acidimicrobiia bacterium]MYB79769.1 S-methyl-5-thioribose-1-phosphate isomerase [Acidimicrobiia bacterium]MYD41630.1 S-methyl-5-thioribose-1-phosphate isomerase [Acidimicrobiia bacterium]